MSAQTPIYKIRTPYKKCRHCGHRVPNPYDTVCPECHIPAEDANRAMGRVSKWVVVALCLLLVLFALPKFHQLLLELADHLGRH